MDNRTHAKVGKANVHGRRKRTVHGQKDLTISGDLRGHPRIEYPERRIGGNFQEKHARWVVKAASQSARLSGSMNVVVMPLPGSSFSKSVLAAPYRCRDATMLGPPHRDRRRAAGQK